MSGRVKMIKKKSIEEPSLDDSEMAMKLRQKATYDYDLENLKSWVDSLDINVSDRTIKPITKMFPVTPNPDKPETVIPANVRPFIEFLLEEYSIPKSQVRAFQFQVVKPLSEYSAADVCLSNDITINGALANTRDRFIFVGGSKELMRYNVINLEQMKKALKLSSNTQIPENYTDQMSRNSIVHMELVPAFTNRLIFNNENSYMRPKKKGYRDGFSIEKNPNKRWIVVLDIIATSKHFDEVLSEKLEFIGHFTGKTKHFSSETKEIVSKITEKCTDTKDDINLDEAPQLVDIRSLDQIKAPDVPSSSSKALIEDISVETVKNMDI